MLSAVGQGLGTCWVGSFKVYEKEIKRIIKAKRNEQLVASIVIGYPKKGYVPLKRKKRKDVMKFV